VIVTVTWVLADARMTAKNARREADRRFGAAPVPTTTDSKFARTPVILAQARTHA